MCTEVAPTVMLKCLLTEKYPPIYAQDWPFPLATNCPNSLFHWRQNIPTTFHNFPMHKCITWDILSPGRKWDILSSWDNLSPENASETMVVYECISGIFCRRGENGTFCRWDNLSHGEKVGHFVIWDNLWPEKCRWDNLSLGQNVS